jgi:hypothetical protein
VSFASHPGPDACHEAGDVGSVCGGDVGSICIGSVNVEGGGGGGGGPRALQHTHLVLQILVPRPGIKLVCACVMAVLQIPNACLGALTCGEGTL